MALSGFEGFEKRLELRFRFFHDPDLEHFIGDSHMGLRLLPIESLEEILRAVHCTVVSSMGNRFFDSYVLLESSLFVYPTKVVIKTCGTTRLLKSIAPLLCHACGLGLELVACRYTRGSFIFPKSQPFPHTSFDDEVACLEENLPLHLHDRKASIMPSGLPDSKYQWHVFVASTGDHYSSLCCREIMLPEDESFTIEVCMTDLDPVSARKFYRPPGDWKTSESAGKEMTAATRIQDINPNALICDFAFDPCGYSMNGLDNAHYSTIHVTPEDGFSYASYEWEGSTYDCKEDIIRTMTRVACVFRPGNMSVSTTSTSPYVWRAIANALEPVGLKCRSYSVDEFPTVGVVAFHALTAGRRNG
ncbi:hypothetical protein MLD38_018025 [Melastoma candidum]|uniref:Uncharacterized protein n=1 Tax=Melastoma candidum TaxID=119954 RepID=A0ACB9QSH3_9MYRT|nr:hypothetical protein MLD38_018025 [Melastoma candidum]